MARFIASTGPGCPEVVISCMEEAAETMAGFYYSAQYEAEAQAAPAEAIDSEQKNNIDEALKVPVPRVALVNRFVPADVQTRIVDTFLMKERPDLTISGVYSLPNKQSKMNSSAFRDAVSLSEEEEGGNLPRIPTALQLNPEADCKKLPCCFMTGAQVLAVQALCVNKGEKVLDLCAGPGAKALLLASALFAPDKSEASPTLLEAVGSEAGVIRASGIASGGRLVLNEPNKARANVLEALLEAFLPGELLAKGGGIKVTRAEIEDKVPLALARLGPYDKILVDPPCTAARAKALDQRYEYNRASVKQNSALQDVLLKSAGALLKPGGIIVYCTCSIEEKENDEVVKHFLKRAGDDFETVNDDEDVPKLKGATPTMHGTGFFPGAGTPHGPLYTSRILRVDPNDVGEDM